MWDILREIKKMRLKLLVTCFLLIISYSIFATNKKFDSLNTYQFNRINYLMKNNKVDRTPWFEWWYYKVVLPGKNKSFFFVYGVVNPWDIHKTQEATRSYVSMGSFADHSILEQQFTTKEFSASYNETHVKVGEKNEATAYHLKGDIHKDQSHHSSWDIAINKKWSFNAASWMTGKNMTNIEWYPAQADALCSGRMIVNGVEETFTDAPCYQDRNWGSLFPQWWAWIVSNHFENSPGTTLAIGGGKPTFFDRYQKIESLAIGLKHQGKEFFWRPHEGSLIRFEINFGRWNVDAINKNYRIKISAHAPREKFMDLQFITPQGLIYHDYEALQGELSVQLFEKDYLKNSWILKDNLNSKQAGIEYGSFQDLGTQVLEGMNLCLTGCL